ncbi:MAG TPA: ATP-binding cassette domain-containing protein [Propionicimonas sp.]|jgi:ABC-2 type transport system ATP-binding protein|uniref:ABC transporter ATP-binding protein n=1 Tax=Propionicimonas sp. TaxID=1955623 RepID=UPI002F3FDE55
MTTAPVITTSGLTKRFGRLTAVADLDLEVRQGEIYAFLGRNGAGKTTTIRMILGLIRPTGGDVRVFGRPVRSSRPEWLRRVGCLVETASAYPNLTVRENLEVHRRLTRAPAAAVPEVIERLGLGAAADRTAGKLSLGNKQRLALARALVHAPDLLVLDEPANALDPAGIVEIRGLLRSLADDHGTTVFVSSHILVEVAHLADRIGIVHDGRLVEELDRAALVAAARAFSAEQLTEQERADALLTLELERYFLARTAGSLR